MDMLLEKFNQNIQEALKKFQDNNNKKNIRRHKTNKWIHRGPKWIPKWNREHHK
jgi:hypothetical protein